MNTIRLLTGIGATLVAFASAAADIPSVSNVTMTQATGSRRVQIAYELQNGPAVITLDIQTNAHDDVWVSIGADAIYSPQGHVFGDVNKVVSGTTGSIAWRPAKTWMKDEGVVKGARAVVTAWPLDDKPPYMVVDVSQGAASADRIRYFQSEEFLPGGLLANTDYRKTKMVMKKVIARNVTWTMGDYQEFGRNAAREKSHRVTLDHNYYLGVFPITQAQFTNIWGRAFAGDFPVNGEMRIRDQIRLDTWQPYARGTGYPADPSSESILGCLRTRTANAVDFDLPSEAEWEYACRAGTREGYWNDGSPLVAYSLEGTVMATDDNLPGRYLNNQAIVGNKTYDDTTMDETSGTPIAGSYAPNAWGFYDMHGGVAEWCLDWSVDDITALNGAVAIGTSKWHIVRGGSWVSSPISCRSGNRDALEGLYWGDYQQTGMRVCCRAGLK